MSCNRIYPEIERLVSYAINTNLIEKEDKIYITNRLMELFKIDEPDEISSKKIEDQNEDDLEDILKNMLDYAYSKKLFSEDTVTYRDLFDTEIMSVLIARPSEVISKFFEKYKASPKEATDFYYKLSGDSNYIRRYRVKNDLRWKTATPYGDIDITINLSKPEKDPKAIAAAKNAKQSSYPKCFLCKENEGYHGRVNHPARQNHRIIPIKLGEEKWNLQYSPYVYYNEHCIVFNSEHVPMKIERDTFVKLFDFIKMFPHYIIGSNADLPIVGGSILTHEHFQGGNYHFLMEKAPIERYFKIKGFEDVKSGILKWPLSVIRLSGNDTDRIIEAADLILKEWRKYSDPDAFIFATTDGVNHSTITPIARKKDGEYELDLVLRNNITTKENPLGVFHPHESLHHIKKENIGLIEVMGLAVLPSRLKHEINLLKDAILNKNDIENIPEIKKHSKWVSEFMTKYSSVDKNNIDDILKNEIGLVFLNVLLDAGVFKRTESGQKAFDKFTSTLN
ncbi:UDP-glucose--hexose-1-phosphate uridylyltransferase [Clostridium sp. BJN0001]|uniref:UDP-glucose--hexose-1-phosphate uridylyltransferase n=1 Tax=Clostridium sp. BJN0001 TaxID=2930219 RepID=UPI001FD2DC25|nr:UDP-glucose--hexose-1-phosphate uridylyltransferase [Clostridium sp. BJN0001]